jgi:hypothetical protein
MGGQPPAGQLRGELGHGKAVVDRPADPGWAAADVDLDVVVGHPREADIDELAEHLMVSGGDG